jgi:hypothetical protein
MWCARDNSVQRIYYGTEGVAPNRTFRVRQEGTSTTFGTVGSPTMVCEWTFYENTPSRIDLQTGINSAKTTGGGFTTQQLNTWGFISGQRIPARVSACDDDIEDLYDVIIFYPSIEGIELYNKFVDKFNCLHNGNTLNYINEQTIFNDNLSSCQLRLLSIFGKFNKNTKLFVYDDIDCYLNHLIQQILLEFLTEINPTCQIVISTNSSSIFIEGWADKVQFIEKLFINHD